MSVFQGPRRSSCVLLPGAGSEMSCLQSDWSTLQDQANLNLLILIALADVSVVELPHLYICFWWSCFLF